MPEWKFNPEKFFEALKEHWTLFAKNADASMFVIGNSGGKDSAVCIYAAAKIFGPKNVIAVSMPNGIQSDISDAEEVVRNTGVNHYTLNINPQTTCWLEQLMEMGIEPTEQTKINLPPRVRMATLYAIAQSFFRAFVVNTDNYDERVTGYFTMYGDGAGDYAPLRGLTVSEVIEFGEWLGIPDHLIHKKPGDGLQALGDEDRLGFKYADLDNFIRYNGGTDEFKKTILERYNKNRFKTDIVDIPGPKCIEYPNAILEMMPF